MSERLIRRLQERLRSEPTVDFQICPPIRPRPPVTESAFVEAEAQLGFPLPPLVRALYTQVADGGYGPGYGVIQLDVHDELSIVATRKRMDAEDKEAPGEKWWPERLVEFVNWGCLYFSGIDCTRPHCPVFFYDPDRAVENVTPADCLIPEADSLAEWLSAWLDGENLWERGRRRRAE